MADPPSPVAYDWTSLTGLLTGKRAVVALVYGATGYRDRGPLGGLRPATRIPSAGARLGDASTRRARTEMIDLAETA